jgi:hypothetical protein
MKTRAELLEDFEKAAKAQWQRGRELGYEGEELLSFVLRELTLDIAYLIKQLE